MSNAEPDAPRQGRTAADWPDQGGGGRDRTREALLDAAQRMWAERGVGGASLRDIAGSAGLTKGAIYSNFTGKTDLLLALLERYAETLSATMADTPVDDASAPGEDRFERAGRAHVERLGTDEARRLELLAVELWLYGMRDYAAGWRIADSYDACRSRLAENLADVGGITARDRATLAMALHAGLARQRLLDPERVPVELYGSAIRLVLGPALA